MWPTTLHNYVAWDEAYLRTKWNLDPISRLATIDMGRKLGALHLFEGRGAGSPSSTMWPGPRPTCMTNVILIHPAPLSHKRWQSQFSAHVYCGQMAEWIKILLGTEVGLDPGDINGTQLLPTKRGKSPQFLAHVYVAKRLDGSRCHLVRR